MNRSMDPPGAGDPVPASETIPAGPGRPLRIGGIDYLNSRPLLEGLGPALGSGFILENHVPRELARRLRAGDLDMALVPVVEYLTGRDDYRIVPGVSISSYGAVESIRLFHRRPLREIRRMGLDTSSMTSVLLVKLLLAEVRPEGAEPPRFEEIPPGDARAALPDDDGPGLDAVLLIGDPAMQRDRHPRWPWVDLGTWWTGLTGLPFVFAFWVHRGPAAPGLAGAIARARDLGRARIDEIVDRGPIPAGVEPADARRYLWQVIHHDLGPAQIEGLLEFRRRAIARGLLPEGCRELRFLEESGERW